MQLKKLVLASAIGALAGCGTEPDTRPATFEVVTLEVLAPSCGQVQCHSTNTWLLGYAFDTLDASRESFKGSAVSPGLPGNSLIDMINGSYDYDRMPPDVPLADQDIQLITKFLQAGRPGL